LARWPEMPALSGVANARARIHLGDLDNNGAVDIVASAGATSAIWLNQGPGQLQRLESVPELFVMSVVDVDGDGLLDLAGTTPTGAAIARTKETKNYHWQALHTRA